MIVNREVQKELAEYKAMIYRERTILKYADRWEVPQMKDFIEEDIEVLEAKCKRLKGRL